MKVEGEIKEIAKGLLVRKHQIEKQNKHFRKSQIRIASCIQYRYWLLRDKDTGRKLNLKN